MENMGQEGEKKVKSLGRFLWKSFYWQSQKFKVQSYVLTPFSKDNIDSRQLRVSDQGGVHGLLPTNPLCLSSLDLRTLTGLGVSA